MIILDTNVISEVMQKRPTQAVLGWLNDQPGVSIWTTAVTVFEIRYGLEIMTKGRQRTALEQGFSQIIDNDLEGRVLPLEASDAGTAALISAERRRAGRTIDIRDACIAGIAVTRKASLATRNVKDFEGVGLTIVNPWTA